MDATTTLARVSMSRLPGFVAGRISARRRVRDHDFAGLGRMKRRDPGTAIAPITAWPDRPPFRRRTLRAAAPAIAGFKFGSRALLVLAVSHQIIHDRGIGERRCIA